MSTDIKSRRDLLVLYGSQTGTAEDVANQISRLAQRLRFQTQVSSMDGYDPNRLLSVEEDGLMIIIFVCSTAGQGSQPDNMTKFWTALRQSSLPSDLLDHIRFTIFGLGDSKYINYNWAARKLYRRLIQLGGECFCERGEADDQHPNGIDGTLLPWLDELSESLLALKPLPEGLAPIANWTLLEPCFRLVHQPNTTNTTQISQANRTNQILTFPESMTVTLNENLRLTASDHWQDTRHLEFEMGGDHHVQFDPGSVAEFLPENQPDDVDRLLNLMNWTHHAHQTYQLVPRETDNQPIPNHWPKLTTLRQMFISRFDILGIPKRSFIEWLSYFTTDQNETERLREFCTMDGQDDLYEYVNRPRRTILEVLSEFRSARIPLDYIHDVFPQIQPRQFSIASSSTALHKKFQILVAVVDYKTRLSVRRKGLCTTWMSGLRPGDQVQVRIQPGLMKFSSDPTQSVVCIGPGTGIAPFRALVQQRSITPPSSNLIIYGCRNLSKDFYYRDEWEKWNKEGVCNLLWAASRDQDLMKENSELVWNFVKEKNASIYICGSSGQMPKSVRKVLQELFEEKEGLNPEESLEKVNQLQRIGRLQEETWG